jgi:dephospho-CoA kinase
VPGLPAADVLELLLGVASPADAAALRGPLAGVGFVTGRPGYASADPGRPARVRVHEVGSPGWLSALRVRDWLRAEPQARAAYAGDPTAREAVAAAWAASSGWAPSLNGTTPDS